MLVAAEFTPLNGGWFLREYNHPKNTRAHRARNGKAAPPTVAVMTPSADRGPL
jgi:hypothetical protein